MTYEQNCQRDSEFGWQVTAPPQPVEYVETVYWEETWVEQAPRVHTQSGGPDSISLAGFLLLMLLILGLVLALPMLETFAGGLDDMTVPSRDEVIGFFGGSA